MAACAKAIPTPRKMALPMIVPRIWLPVLVMFVSFNSMIEEYVSPPPTDVRRRTSR